IGEAHERLECNLIAEPVLATDLEHLRADEALDQSEDVRVGATLNLADKAALRLRQERQPVDHRQSVRKEFLANVEFAPTKHVAFDVPTDALGHFDDLGI